MSLWPRYPTIFEINTWVWLSSLSTKYGTAMKLDSVPSAEWDCIAALGLDVVWLMGVWERSPAGIDITNRNQSLLDEFRRVLPDFYPEDNIGSAYCIRRYVVDEHLGGPEGLAIARNELAKRGLRLILDFVPNHVAPDHPWVAEHPEYFILGDGDSLKNDPAAFVQVGDKVFACGRDPYFPAWPDVVQLNAFQIALRETAIRTIDSIATQCDGIRCDMAMLLMNSIFERTWGSRAGQPPATEYWVDIIPAVKTTHPEFLFIAEAYWDLEWELQQQGFDFCYDKRLYDRLENGTPGSIRLHLLADPGYQGKLLRFIENHDEPRAATAFPAAKERAAAVTIATLPGAKLFHEGQFDGRKIRVPVFLGRRPEEATDQELLAFYKRLVKVIDNPFFRDAQWSLCICSGWTDNQSFQNLLAWNWIKGEKRYLIVVNLSDRQAQGRVRVSWNDIAGKTLRLVDLLSNASYDRSGDELSNTGLYVDLSPWTFHLLSTS